MSVTYRLEIIMPVSILARTSGIRELRSPRAARTR